MVSFIVKNQLILM